MWENLVATDASTLMTFLRARIAAGESLASSGVILGTRNWWLRAGSIEESTVSKKPDGTLVKTIRAEVIEVVQPRPFTVGVSLVGGPDKIS